MGVLDGTLCTYNHTEMYIREGIIFVVLGLFKVNFQFTIKKYLCINFAPKCEPSHGLRVGMQCQNPIIAQDSHKS